MMKCNVENKNGKLIWQRVFFSIKKSCKVKKFIS